VNAIKPIPLISTPGFGEVPAAEVCERMKVANARETPKLDKATADLYKKEFYEGTLGKNCGEFAGRKVDDAKDDVVAWLKKKGVATDFYETSRQAKCRCGGQVVAAVLPNQWFIDFNAPGWKDRANECLERMFVFPPNYKKQFEDIFAWLDKRPCARRRGLGTQLPFANEWIIESLSDSTIYMAFYAVIKQVRRFGLKPEQLREEFFDFVLLGGGTAESVAKTCGVEPAVLKSLRKEFEYWYPNDLRHTAVAHITNHLSFFIFAHTAVFGPKHWPRALSLNEMLVREGAKMSKSKGNVIILSNVKEKYGADLFRLYVSAAAEFGSILDFRDKDLEATRRSFVKWSDLVLSLNELSKKAPKKQPDSIAVKWMLSKFETSVLESTKALEEFSLRNYVQSAFYNLLNAWDYFSRRAAEDEKAFAAREIAGRWILLLSPVVPHVCEELWEASGGKGFASHAAWPEAREQRIAPEIEEAEDYVAAVFADLRKVRELVKIKASKATVIVSSKAKAEAMTAALRKAAKPGELVLPDEALRQYAAKNFFELRERRGLDEYGALS
ncbi:MAG: class I tRNA ligase family protein, partial [Candidatus Micrarchaeota archaeon]